MATSPRNKKWHSPIVHRCNPRCLANGFQNTRNPPPPIRCSDRTAATHGHAVRAFAVCCCRLNSSRSKLKATAGPVRLKTQIRQRVHVTVMPRRKTNSDSREWERSRSVTGRVQWIDGMCSHRLTRQLLVPWEGCHGNYINSFVAHLK